MITRIAKKLHIYISLLLLSKYFFPPTVLIEFTLMERLNGSILIGKMAMKCLSGLPQGHAVRERGGEIMFGNLVPAHCVKTYGSPGDVGKENCDLESQIK